MNRYISIETSDGAFRAYVAAPAAPSSAVVVLQELFGVNRDLRETCDELAAQGYLAISPDLFWRLEPGVDLSDQTENEWKQGLALYKAYDFQSGVQDIGLTLVKARTLISSGGKVGLLGYCLGGLMTFLTAARKGVDAAVVYYGSGMERHLDEAKNIMAPLLVHLGEEDEYISKPAQKAIIEELGHDVLAQVFTYSGCKHAFARHHGIHYDQKAAALANDRTADFLKRHIS